MSFASSIGSASNIEESVNVWRSSKSRSVPRLSGLSDLNKSQSFGPIRNIIASKSLAKTRPTTVDLMRLRPVKLRHHDKNDPINPPIRFGSTLTRQVAKKPCKVSVVAHVSVDDEPSEGEDDAVIDLSKVAKTFQDKIASRTVHTHAFIEIFRVLNSPLEADKNHTVVKINGKYVECGPGTVFYNLSSADAESRIWTHRESLKSRSSSSNYTPFAGASYTPPTQTEFDELWKKKSTVSSDSHEHVE